MTYFKMKINELPKQLISYLILSILSLYLKLNTPPQIHEVKIIVKIVLEKDGCQRRSL